ncbi:MAG: c-type cytochrome [Bryobacteraceae bacterium]|nr:c-type cytochrome [Bryobacteraceae bacterium]
MRLLLVFPLAAMSMYAQHGDAAGKPAQNPAIGDPAAIDAGKKLFAGGCGGCHGPDGAGGRGPSLRDKVMWHSLDDSALYTTIEKGIAGTEMPASRLPAAQLWQVVAFVRSLSSPAAEMNVPGDARAGETVFSQAGCVNCHARQGRGGKLGPDLSNAGATRSYPTLRESIVDPDANGAVGYRAISVKLRNGQELSGVERNRSNYSLQLQDRAGAVHLIDMADVAEMKDSRTSPMPKDYGRRLSKPDLENLLAYLSKQSLRPVMAEKR